MGLAVAASAGFSLPLALRLLLLGGLLQPCLCTHPLLFQPVHACTRVRSQIAHSLHTCPPMPLPQHYSVDVVVAFYTVPLVFYTLHRRWTTKRPVSEGW